MSAKPRPVTIKDIAQKTGLSIATVGRAMGEYGRVSEATRQKVLAAARELNFSPNASAQSLKGGRTNTIGLMIANVANPFFSLIVRAVEDTSQANNYSVIVCNIDEDHKKESSYLSLLRSKRVDGLLVCSSFSTKREMNREIVETYESEIPTVFVDRHVEGLSRPYVQTDSFHGSIMAVNYLAGLGHARIGLLSHAPSVDTLQKRVLGYKKGLADNGIKYDPKLIGANDANSTADGFKTARRLLEGRNRPTALLATNYLITIGAILAVKELGLRIPQDVSLIGWDDFELAPAMSPPITVVTQPTYSIGSLAASTLFNMLNGTGTTESVTLLCELIIRESCAPAANR